MNITELQKDRQFQGILKQGLFIGECINHQYEQRIDQIPKMLQ